MISKILAIGGVGLLAFGAYCMWAKNKKTASSSSVQKELDKNKAAMAKAQVDAPASSMPMDQPGNAATNPYSGALKRFDINPQVLFSPPTTTVMVPSTDIADVVMVNSANQLVTR